MILNLPLPSELESTMLPTSAALHFAVGAFSAEEVTLGQAAAIAGLSQSEFMRELARRKIPLHYDCEDFAEDLKTIAALQDRLGNAGHQ